MEHLFKSIENKDITVGVVGLGYVGLPQDVEFGSVGIQTIGIDVNQARVDQLNAGENYTQDINDVELKARVDAVTLTATTDFSSIQHIDAICIVGPTPLSKTKDQDSTLILSLKKATIRGTFALSHIIN